MVPRPVAEADGDDGRLLSWWWIRSAAERMVCSRSRAPDDLPKADEEDASVIKRRFCVDVLRNLWLADRELDDAVGTLTALYACDASVASAPPDPLPPVFVLLFEPRSPLLEPKGVNALSEVGSENKLDRPLLLPIELDVGGRSSEASTSGVVTVLDIRLIARLDLRESGGVSVLVEDVPTERAEELPSTPSDSSKPSSTNCSAVGSLSVDPAGGEPGSPPCTDGVLEWLECELLEFEKYPPGVSYPPLVAPIGPPFAGNVPRMNPPALGVDAADAWMAVSSMLCSGFGARRVSG